MNPRRTRICLVTLLLLTFANLAPAQAIPAAGAPVLPSDGIDGAGYRIHQTIELGYRVSDTTGSNAMYYPLVDLHGGPRVLEQSLSVQSIEHQGVLCSTISSSPVSAGAVTRTMACACVSTGTIGTTSAETSAATRTISTTTCWPTRSILPLRTPTCRFLSLHTLLRPPGA
jgi:hypothetical protein